MENITMKKSSCWSPRHRIPYCVLLLIGQIVVGLVLSATEQEQINMAAKLYKKVCADCQEELSISREYVPVTQKLPGFSVTTSEPVGKAHYYVGNREVSKSQYDDIGDRRVADYNRIIHILEPLVIGGNVEAQDWLGYIYWNLPNGITVNDRVNLSFKWSSKAGRAGSVNSAERCALIWLDKETKGTREQKIDNAIEWYEIVANNLISCRRFSEVYKYADRVHKLGAPYRAKAIVEKVSNAQR